MAFRAARSADTPYQRWQDVEKAAKANPKKVTCATVGSGLRPKTGLKDFVIHNCFGLVGPGGLPPELQKRWNDALAKPVASPELKQKFADNGLQIVIGSKAGFDEEIAADRLT